MHLNLRRMAIGLVTALAVVAAEAQADDHRDHDVARQAVERGEIKSLAEILQAVRDKLPGEIAGVKIEREGGRLTYELRIVGARGRLLKVHVDAATGEIGRIQEK
ncbi:PepSY domain-containing protein [Bradyrhizobium sp. AUGA SZCCT0283]|nr:PepSY domain-containing protein [Bradyrhizobium sp. AUGA SZCCT0283]